MGFQISGVDHGRLLFAMLSGQADHHLGKDAFVAPPLPAVVQGLVRPVLPGRIPPSQPIAVDEDNSTQNAPIINAWLAMGLGKEGLQTRHLGVT
ncbi:hypothetical protein SAMN05444358_11635 [Ruegeria halocynthiae]|uniref:Uncharacterized protein n=1 Tax=Ruegeria halocynthiae TaxID=985054 RepID=A0A1H3FMD2_9RHOB|nr:hypothetical protein SAMN05444358_11635 [Ruegeria halocynthiae]